MIPQTLISAVVALGVLTTTAPSVDADLDRADILADAAGEGDASERVIPSHIDVSRFEHTRADGTRVWGTTAVYELSTGDIAEVYMEIDSNEAGEVYFAINGEIVSYTGRTTPGADGRATVTSWAPQELNYPPEVLTELMQDVIAQEVINGTMPQEFPCSEFGKKVVKGVKYLWIAANGAFGGICCMPPTTGACPLCLAGAAASIEAGAELADGYCD